MINLIVLFFVGKYFYELAQDYYKHRWLYLFLGIATYVAGIFLGVYFILFLQYIELIDFNWSDSFNIFLLEFGSGLTLSFIVYIGLNWYWKKNNLSTKDEIQNIGKDFE